jgi:hypothetical protein
MQRLCAALIVTLLALSAEGQTPTPVPVCGAVPLASCKTPVLPLSGKFMIKNLTPDERDGLRWEWWEGSATSKAELGDPLTSTSYALCVFDFAAGVPSLVWSVEIPPGGTCAGRPCWKETDIDFVYKDRDMARRGVRRIRLRPGGDGQALNTVFAKRANLVPPNLPLGQDGFVVAQLVNSLGVCWQASYSPPSYNEPNRFRDAND